jgi:hypothetical protein
VLSLFAVISYSKLTKKSHTPSQYLSSSRKRQQRLRRQFDSLLFVSGVTLCKFLLRCSIPVIMFSFCSLNPCASFAMLLVLSASIDTSFLSATNLSSTHAEYFVDARSVVCTSTRVQVTHTKGRSYVRSLNATSSACLAANDRGEGRR